jgi:hypothetical protein
MHVKIVGEDKQERSFGRRVNGDFRAIEFEVEHSLLPLGFADNRKPTARIDLLFNLSPDPARHLRTPKEPCLG